MGSLANIAAQQTAGAARETFGREHAASLSKEAAAFDPFGAKATKAEREKASLSMQDEQLKHAQLSRKLKEDAAAAQKDLQKLQMSKFNPNMVADVYSASEALDGEYQFDQRHFNETGKIKLRKGKFNRNDMGERAMHDDGTFIFSPTDEKFDIEFENKQDMIDHVQGSIFDPKVRMAALLNKDEFEFFKKKTKVTEESKSSLQKERHKQKIKETETSIKGQKDVASIYAAAKGTTAGLKGAMTEKQKADLKIKGIDDFRNVLTESINEQTGEERENLFTRPETEKVMAIIADKKIDFKKGMARAAESPENTEKWIKYLKSKAVPKAFLDYIEVGLMPEEEVEVEKKTFLDGLFGN